MMFFFISKFVSFLVSPFIWAIFFLCFGVLANNSKKKRKLILASLFILIFFSNTFIFDRFQNAWETGMVSDEDIGHFEVSVVLAGMSTWDPANDRLEFNDRTDRIMQAIRLYKAGKFDKLILCGSATTLSENDTMDVYRLRDYLAKTGMPASAILVESKSRNTHENALNVKTIVAKHFPGKTVLLISSGLHLRRAAACFHKAGMRVIPYCTDRIGGPVKYRLDYLLLPDVQTLFNWEILLHEWTGMIIYKIAGYV